MPTKLILPYVGLIMLLCSWQFGSYKAENAILAENSKAISFFQEGVFYQTGGEKKYLGQTSLYIFLFDTTQNQTLIFSKDGLSSFKSKLD